MASALERGLQILELLSERGQPMALAAIASSLSIPKSAAHRTLAELGAAGFVQPTNDQGSYGLTLKLSAMGLRHLAANDLVSLSAPALKELANKTSELVRLAVLDGEGMLWVAAHQGARSGLRYDPESGNEVILSCSASGFAWLAQLPEEVALQKVLRQGIASAKDYGPKAPQTIDEIRAELARTRERGFALVMDSFAVGIGAIAAAVFVNGTVAGTVSLAGPTARLDQDRLIELAPQLLDTTHEITEILEAISSNT